MTMRRPSLRFVRPALYVALSCLVVATPAAAQRTHVLIVSGISGEPRFAEQWSAWSGSLATGLREAGVAAADIVRLDERGGDGAAARSTKEEIGRQVVRIAAAAAADDQVLLVFFGHGSGDGGATRINLPGPDLAASELAAMLTSFPTQRVIIVNAASASGGFVEPLAGANRVIITATRSAGQDNETIFGEYFAAAFEGGTGDTDKDGRVSLLEAFAYARLEVERAYASTNRMRTEHALLDADGDGIGVTEPDGSSTDAQVAAAIWFGTGGSAAVTAEAPADASPELRALYERRAALQSQVDALRARRSSMNEAQYEQELEALLVELATTNQAIRRIEGGSR